MSDLSTLVNALAFYPAGYRITADSVREALDAAQVPENARGPLFGAACRNHYLLPLSEARSTTWPPGNGRLIRVYLTTAKARQETRAVA